MKKILVVDDDNNTRKLISSMIRYIGYKTAECPDGTTALEVLKRDPEIGLLVSDIVMQEMDGFELIKIIRDDARFEGLPVILISGVVKEEGIEDLTDTIKCDFIRKPLMFSELKDCIEKHIGPSPNGNRNFYKAQNIMTKDVITVRGDMLIAEAIGLLIEKKVSGLPVVDDEMRLTGILSEKDVLKMLYNDFITENEKVSDYMTSDVIGFDAEDNVLKIGSFLMANNFRRVPILRDDKVVGIISRREIVKFIMENTKKQ